MTKQKFGEAKSPFTMKGHTLPGINQRSPAKQAIGGGPGEAVAHHKAYMKKKKVLDASQKYYKSMSVTDAGLEKSKKITSKYIDHAVKRGSDYEWKIRSARNQKFVEHAKTAIKTPKPSLTSQIVKGVTKRLPVIGEALMTYDVLKEGVKRVAKGIKTRIPQTKLTGKNIKDTFKRVEKKKYTK